MKLLGWMHRKFKQTNNEPLKEPSIGRSSLDDLHYLQKPGYCTKSLNKGRRDMYLRSSFSSLEAAKIEEDEEYYEEESSDTCSKLFHGFLAIGTFGADPSTPTFSISAQTIAENETEVTENELKLINDELEKVLGTESLSSGRNSHVSTGRTSYCSSVSLNGKPMENGDNTCPLQDYLFGSAIELAETIPVYKKETRNSLELSETKKENRTSLGELFQKTKAEENNGARKEGDKSAVNLVKKMLKKKSVNAFSRNPTSDFTSAETKMQKILQKFHRKIHPEGEEKRDKTSKNVRGPWPAGTGTSNKGASGSLVSTGEDIIIFPHRSFPRGSVSRKRRNSIDEHPPQLQYSISDHHADDSHENGECWIKTDADYLVLEL